MDTDISTAADVCLNVAEYSAYAFDCALSGPFADLFLTRLSASRALCEVMIDFISASTVYHNIISRVFLFVNTFLRISDMLY